MFTLDCVNYGRFSFDGSVFGFIDEFVANVLCSLVASPVYVMVRLAENFSEHFDRTRVAVSLLDVVLLRETGAGAACFVEVLDGMEVVNIRPQVDPFVFPVGLSTSCHNSSMNKG